ncbi:MAG: hypothetical protein V1495_03605 [Pseudomonadota bacterium]
MKAKSLFLSVLLAGCAGGTSADLEQIQFMLDHGQFAAAVTQAQAVVNASPTNLEAQFLLASAQIGDSMLGTHSRCKATDTGYIGLLACLQDPKTATDPGDFGTFLRIAPDTTAKLSILQDATNGLIALTGTQKDPGRLRDVYLQLWMARLFEIGSVTTQLGACTASFDPNALSADELQRFKDNLANVNSDGANAGLPSSLGLNDRITSISNDLNETTAPLFFQATFGGC